MGHLKTNPPSSDSLFAKSRCNTEGDILLWVGLLVRGGPVVDGVMRPFAGCGRRRRPVAGCTLVRWYVGCPRGVQSDERCGARAGCEERPREPTTLARAERKIQLAGARDLE